MLSGIGYAERRFSPAAGNLAPRQMYFSLLGALEVSDDGRPLALGGVRQRAILALLLIHRKQPISGDRIVDELWGEHPPPTAAKTVQVYVSRLRKTLGAQALLTQPEGYALDVERAEVDVDLFESLVTEGHHRLAVGEPGAAAQSLERALGLWRGEPLADFAYEEFAQFEISRLQELRLDALEDRVEADLALGRERQLLGELEELTRANPNRERFLAQLMTALYRCDRHADALEAYRRGRDALTEQLGLTPGIELRALEERILKHDPELEGPHRGRRGALKAVAPRSIGALMIAGSLLLLGAAVALAIALTKGGASVATGPPNSLVGIDIRTDQIDGIVPVGAGPDAVAYGSTSLWVANADDRTVSRVDPVTLQTLRTLTLSGTPTGLASAGGAIWVATTNSGSSVSAARIDPEFDTVEPPAKIYNTVPESNAAIAAASGDVWVAPYSGELTELSAITGRVLRVINPNAAPAGVAVGAGAVWVPDPEAGDVDRVDSHGAVRSIPVGKEPCAVAIGAGAVWVADAAADTVVRIDPKTDAPVSSIAVGAAPSALAVGAGSVWVADAGDGTVERISPASNQVTARIAVGGSPGALTIADGRAWVTLDTPEVRASFSSRGGVARIDSSYDVSSMDPALADDALSWQLLYATCAHLVNYPDKSGPAGRELIPEVAQALPTVSRSSKRYTFTIRRGFRFSPPSNTPVTGEAFKYAIERTMNPRMNSPLAVEFRDIVGADAYNAGRADQISGIKASAEKVVFELTEPAPSLLARLTEPAACAVPPDTPFDPRGVREIPSAGPYEIASYAPGRGIVLTRNPNYHGRRPHAIERFEVAVDVPAASAVRQVEHGQADYAINEDVPAPQVPLLTHRYGAGSPAAEAGHQQYFAEPDGELSFLALNSRRGLFSSERMRRAINLAIDRAALARVGAPHTGIPETPIDHYLTPGMPGYVRAHALPSTPDLIRARQLAAAHDGATAVLYTCAVKLCEEKAQLIKAELAAIGLHLRIERFPPATLYARLETPGEPFDMATVYWSPSYPDPEAILNYLIEGGQTIPPLLDDPSASAHLASAARLLGPKRFSTYGRLDLELSARVAPMIAYGYESSHELFSARTGCEKFGAYDLDIAALCIRRLPR